MYLVKDGQSFFSLGDLGETFYFLGPPSFLSFLSAPFKGIHFILVSNGRPGRPPVQSLREDFPANCPEDLLEPDVRVFSGFIVPFLLIYPVSSSSFHGILLPVNEHSPSP